MFFPQGFKKAAGVAERQMGNAATQAVEAKNYVLSIGRRSTATLTSTTSSSSTRKTASSTTASSSTITEIKAIQHPSNASLMANTLLWAHLIPPMPVIASTMYRHYAKGNTEILTLPNVFCA